MSGLVVIDHPLVAHKLSLMRSKATPSAQFRTLLREISLLLGYEVLRDLPTELRDIETPVGPTRAPFLKGKKLVFVPILRAGSGLLDGLLDLVPSARVGHIGALPRSQDAGRDRILLQAARGHRRAPDRGRRSHAGDRATPPSPPSPGSRRAAPATSASSACWRRRRASPSWRARTRTCASSPPPLDERLNDHGYIVPGLGDAGDRLYGTK